jgi:hypothetical protein
MIISKLPHKIKQVLKISALVTISSFLLLSVFLVFLPKILNSTPLQNRLKHTLSSTMKRPVSWSVFVLSWSGGLTLSDLTIGDGPAPLLKTAIGQMVIAPSFGRGADGRFGIDLAVKIQNVRAELAPGPAKTPPPPSDKDPLTQIAEAIQKIQGLDFPAPVELRVTVEVSPLNLTYRAPAPGKSLALNDFFFRFAMPSLMSRPITADMHGRVSVDGHEMGNISLSAKVSDLVTGAQRIHLASALFAVDASAPGTGIVLTGGLSHADGFKARWKVDLPALLKMAQPFVLNTVPELAGGMELVLAARADTNRDLHATVTLTGAGIAARGGSLKEKRFGPLDVSFQQRIMADHVRQIVNFPDGMVKIPAVFDAAWSASVNRPTLPGREVHLQLGSVKLDLARALTLAAPFLPPDSPAKNLSGEALLHSLAVNLTGPAMNGNVALSGLDVTLPNVRVAQKTGDLTAENVHLFLERFECPLVAKQPVKAAADLRWSIGKATLPGAKPLSLQGAKGTVGVAVSDINLKSASPRKVAATVLLTQALDLERATFGAEYDVKNVHEQLRLLARAGENGVVEIRLPECTVSVASLQASQAGKRVGPLPVSAHLTADSITLSADKNVKPTLQRAVAALSAGDFLQLNGEASLSSALPQRVATSGTVRLDLKRAMPVAAPFLPSGLKAEGIVTTVWSLAAPLPAQPSAADKHPLRSAQAALALLDTCDLLMKLEAISATLPSAGGKISVAGLHTTPDLKVAVTKRGELVQLSGGVQFAGVSGLSGVAGKLPLRQGVFSFNSELAGWKEFRLSEEFRFSSPALAHEAELNVSRIDALLEEKKPFNPATLLKRLDATLFVTVDGAFSREMVRLLPGLDLSGELGSSVRVDLTAGRELAAHVSLKTRDFGVQMDNGTKMEGLRSDITLRRSYALAADQGEKWQPLSAALVRPVVRIAANPGAAEIAGRISDDLRGDLQGTRSFSIRRVTTKASGVPLTISALEGDLLLGQETFGLGFFQADLLGGTILARSLFDLKPELPVINAAGSFSNLDITRLLPAEARARGENRDAEITGEVRVTAPLTAEQRELSEQLRFGLNLRKIGANTLERALYSLDPYERNEQVVAQRKMLRMGSLKSLRATAVDGAFSMEGEAVVKGVALQLPKVERLRISELSQLKGLVTFRKPVATLRGVLDLVRADSLVVGPKGEISLKRRMYEK